MVLDGFRQVLKEFAHLAAEQAAELIYGRQIDSRGSLFVKGGDRAAVEPSLPHDIRDAKLVASHQH